MNEGAAMHGKKGQFFWPLLSVNISSVCLRSLCKINILHIEQIIILARPGHCMIACEHVFKCHAWLTGRDHPYREPLHAVGCVLSNGAVGDDSVSVAAQTSLEALGPVLCGASCNSQNNKYAHPAPTNQNKA